MSGSTVKHLNDHEVSTLFTELAQGGLVRREGVEKKLQSILLDCPGRRSTYHLRWHQCRSDGVNLTAFLDSLFPEYQQALDFTEFTDLAKTWEIPTQSRCQSVENCVSDEEQELTFFQRIGAWFSLEAPRVIFVSFVVSVQIALCVWQFWRFMSEATARHALGWGVVVAKTAAGPIYPTIFFMMLSMSRWLATWARVVPGIRRIVNWDLYRGFHIYMTCSCLFFATIHAIGHICGDFVWGSRPDHAQAVVAFWGIAWSDVSYSKFFQIIPGWSGVVALGIFWIIFCLSMPAVRRWSFEVFQIGHLLLYPFIGFLCAHGTLALLQPPMLGYWLAAPAALVLFERMHRVYRGFIHLPARAEALDKDTITLDIRRRWGRPWRYSAGQYVLLQVPSMSRWQWHPFTISSCDSDRITLHIRTDGDWTKQLRRMTEERHFFVGIDGPFGAPAQQIYQFERSIVVGSGIGVTPMSSISSDFARQMQKRKDPWRKQNRFRQRAPLRKAYTPTLWSKSNSEASLLNFGGSKTSLTNFGSTTSLLGAARSSARNSYENILSDLEKGELAANEDPSPAATESGHSRRVDLHWITRDPKSLEWFADHLNRAQDAAESLAEAPSESPSVTSLENAALDAKPNLSTQFKFNVNTYVTAPSASISVYVLRHLLDRWRSSAQTVSALTSLKNNSIFSKPNFGEVLEKFHSDLVNQRWTGGEVGVFFCGNPAIGSTLREACRKQTERARKDRSRVRYVFIGEVF